METRKKKLLVLKGSKDVCGDEIGLITHQARLLMMEVVEEQLVDETSLESIFAKYDVVGEGFDYLYLCTHGNKDGFEINTGAGNFFVQWWEFAGILCPTEVLNEDAIILLACCKGGLFKVTSEIMAACSSIGYVCGVKWSLANWDLTTGFIVFLYCMEVKFSEPSFAARKASEATDYTFVCYERTEIESNPQFSNIQDELFRNLNWTDNNGAWIEENEQIKKNVGIK